MDKMEINRRERERQDGGEEEEEEEGHVLHKLASPSFFVLWSFLRSCAHGDGLTVEYFCAIFFHLQIALVFFFFWGFFFWSKLACLTGWRLMLSFHFTAIIFIIMSRLFIDILLINQIRISSVT